MSPDNFRGTFGCNAAGAHRRLPGFSKTGKPGWTAKWLVPGFEAKT
jgi:hypothetical protein